MNNISKEMLIQSLSDFDTQTLSLALLYARNITTYGIDVTQAWQTAVENSDNISKAYNRGFNDAMERMLGDNKDE